MGKKRSYLKNTGLFLTFAGPAMIAFFAVVIIPFLYGLYLTFTNWDVITNNYDFVGVSNYISVFKDPEFLSQMILTFKYVFFTVLICNGIGFLLAYILTSGIKNQNFLRAGFFVPNLIGGIVLGYIWKFIFANVFTILGSGLGIDLFSTSWLTDPDKSVWAMIIVTAWQYAGYLMIIYIAGFMSVPKELLEAASLDGAFGLKKLFYITVPMIIPAVVICLFISISRGFMAYDLNLSLTNGEPYGSSRLISMHVYQKAFLSKEYGIGQAEAVILFIIVAIISVTQVYLTKKQEVEA